MIEGKGDPWTDVEFEESVRATAYFLWEHDGRPAGSEKDYWFRALELKLRQRRADRNLQEEPRHTHQIDDNQDDLGQDVSSST